MKKKIVLLPIIMLALVGCGSNNSVSDSISDTSENSATSTTPSNPNFPIGITHDGTENDPFTVADAILMAEFTGTTATKESYYVKGIVTKVDASSAAQYGNITIELSDQGASNKFTAYGINGLRNEKFTSETALDVVVGATVVVTGPIINFMGNTPEITFGDNSYLVSLDLSTVPNKVEYYQAYTLDENSTYKLGVSTDEGTDYFINGKMGGTGNYYMDTTPFFGDGIDIKVEKDNNSYFLYHEQNNQKIYLDLVASDGHKNAVYTNIKPSAGLSFDEELFSPYKVFDGVKYYLSSRTTRSSYLAGYDLDDGEIYVTHFFKEGQKEVIHVNGINVTTEVEVRATLNIQLDARVTPSYADDQELIYESLNEDIAIVSSEGLVTGIDEGETQILIKAHEDETIAATVNVKVLEAPLTARYTFEGALDASKSSASGLSTSDAILNVFHSDSELMPTSVSNISKVYAGANGGSGENKWTLHDVIKFGTSSENGTLDLTFDDEIKIEKVVVTMAPWESKDTLSINGVSHSATAPNVSGNVVPEDVEYVLEDATNVLEFVTKNRMVIWGFEITYSI